MNRRNMLTALAGATMLTFAELTGSSWITVADTRLNANLRTYSEHALQAMCRELKHAKIVEGWPSVQELSLDMLRGVVTAARRNMLGDVQVHVRWFQGLAPRSGGYLTPTGVGIVSAHGVVETYELSYLTISHDSAFKGATKL